LPGGRLRSTGSFQLAQVAQSLDWVNLLTYDFHGDWDQRTNFNSPFLAAPNDPTPSLDRATWNVSGTVDWYLASGVPAHKLVVGIPFYVRQYLRVPAENDGLYQPFNNSGLDANALQWDRTPTPTFHDLVDVVHILEPGAGPAAESQGRDGYTRYWSAGAGEPWLYHPAAVRFGEKTGVFFSYEDPRSIAQRISLIRERQLGGAMFWEISQDSDGHDLLNALAPLLGDAEAGTENPRYGPER
jgi:chitinase